MKHLTPATRETIICLSPLLYVVALFAVVFLLSLIPVLVDRSCAHAGALSQSATAMLEGFACAEFFLNRYQTLLGIGGALAAAIIAAAPVWRQVKLTGMQAALQLQPVIVAMEAEIADDLRIVEETIIIERRIDNLFFLANVACEEGAHGSIVDHVHREMGAIDDLLDIADERSMPRFVDRLRLTPEVRALRRRLRTILLAFRHSLRRPPPRSEQIP